jgi:general secretion pathway protein F
MIGFDMIPWLGRDRWTITPMWLSEDRLAVEGSLLRILALAHREGLDPKRTVELFAQEHWGINRWRFNRFAKRLDSQTPLIQALMDSGLASDDHTVVCLRIAESIPNPARAWEEIVRWHRPMNAESIRLWRNQMFYWTVVGLILLSVSSAFWFLIGPVFERMLSEFDMSEQVRSFQWMPAITLPFAALLMAALLIYWMFRLFHAITASSLTVQMQTRRGSGSRKRECLRQVAVCIRGNLDDRGTLETLLKCNPNPAIQRTLKHVLGQVNEGISVWQALGDAGFLNRRQALAMQSCESPDVRSWGLEQFTLEEREAKFFARLASGLWVQPALALAFGVVVLLTGYVLIDSLSELIRVLAERHG